jgi:DNA-binding transcriptional LysR family regulator
LELYVEKAEVSGGHGGQPPNGGGEAMVALSEADLRTIRVFMTVAESHGLAAAQSELGMATSTISHHLSALEDRLGARLCQRGRSGFLLTPEGRTVYDAALRLFKGLEAFQTEVDTLHGELGTLRIGAIDTGLSDSRSPLLQAVKRYNERRNTSRLSVMVDDVTSLEKLVIAGQLDLAVACTPRKIEGIKYTYLYDQWQMLYCGENHPFFAEPDDKLSNERLSQQRVVSRDFWAAIEAERFLLKRADATINNIEAKLHLILTGSYIGFMPAFYAKPWVDAGRLRAVRPRDFSWTTSYYVMMKRGTVLSRQVRAFLQDIRDVEAAA